MKKMNSKTFNILVASSLLVIVVVLAIVLQPSSDRSGSMMPRLINQGMSPATDMMYEYDVAESGATASMDSGMMVADGYKLSMPAPSPNVGGLTAAEAEQRIIKTADLALSVDGVESKTHEIISLANGRGGFVQSSTIIEDEDGYKNSYVTVRVPSDTFEDTVAAIKELAVRVDRESINGRDVTEQYTDLEARLRSAQAQEEQYLEILDQAQTVQDILAVQSYLQSIRYEIESLQGQLDSLGNQTAYSTISVTLQEEVRVDVPAEKFDLVRDVKFALKYVVLLAQTLLTYLVWFVIVGGAILIPLSLFVGLIVWLVRKIIARF